MGGSVINISSGLGREAYPGYGAYGVSRWGLEGLTLYLALELKPSRVRVNSVAPGYVGTAKEILKRATTAEKLIPWISDPLNIVLDQDDPEAMTLALKTFFDTYVTTGQRLTRPYGI
jgi:NAD(P)-dependent dehydrogenase (short-subunit alcohol dehydrogenase family)